MSYAGRQIDRLARQKAREKRAKDPGRNLGQMNFDGFAMQQKKQGVLFPYKEDDPDG